MPAPAVDPDTASASAPPRALQARRSSRSAARRGAMPKAMTRRLARRDAPSATTCTRARLRTSRAPARDEGRTVGRARRERTGSARAPRCPAARPTEQDDVRRLDQPPSPPAPPRPRRAADPSTRHRAAHDDAARRSARRRAPSAARTPPATARPAGKRASKSREQLVVLGVEVDDRRRRRARRASSTRGVLGEHVGVGAQRRAGRWSSSPARSAARGTRSARAPSKTPIAAPIAVSSWTTSGDDGSVGSTVLRLTIIGRPSTPSRSSSSVAQRPQVDPQVVRVEEAVAVDVLEGVEVLVGRLRDLAQHQAAVPARRARWPPLRSASVRSATSMTNGISSRANQARMRGSSTAPRLSEFETNA